MTGLTVKMFLNFRLCVIFVNKKLTFFFSFRTVILCHSVIHSKCPPQQSYVRAWLQSNECLYLSIYFSRSFCRNVFYDCCYSGGGFVVSPLNQGKECVVKHMLSIDWKLWRTYLPKTPARTMTIRMLGRVSGIIFIKKTKTDKFKLISVFVKICGSFVFFSSERTI